MRNPQFILEEGNETNNHLESFNKKWNKLVGCHPNVWSVQESFIKTEADTRRSFMANAAGQDLNSNSGRRKQSLDFRARIRFIVNGYETATKADYLSMIAHELTKEYLCM